MRQEDVPLGEARCPSLLTPCLLPSMWQLYPGRRYRGSDSSFWRIVYHIEASVSSSRTPSSHLGWACPVLLAPPPGPHVWLLRSIHSLHLSPKAKQVEGVYNCRFFKDWTGETSEDIDWATL